MSIDINWDTLTGGPDGIALAEKIRTFVHDRFQTVPLPRMIRSVNVHLFDFGETRPEVELKDVCDPLPDFYEDDEDDIDATPESIDAHSRVQNVSHDDYDSYASSTAARSPAEMPARDRAIPTPLKLDTAAMPPRLRSPPLSEASHSLSGTPGLIGPMSNLGYFHLPLSAGLSGTSTPLAAVAGANYPHPPWTDQRQHQALPPPSAFNSSRDRTTSFSSITPPSTTPTSRPVSRHLAADFPEHPLSPSPLDDRPRSLPEASPDDLQIVFKVSYDGNVKLSLTCEILLDYPTQSFVGIPLQLNITGLTFNGIGILAYVRKAEERRAHFCFLAPDDASSVVGGLAAQQSGHEGQDGTSAEKGGFGGLIEEIKVESEIGQRQGNKQSLKNVGKVEKFVLEQVRRIFEEEFVYPSFWTFLV